MRHRVFAVADRDAGGFEPCPRFARELDADDWVEAPVRDRDRQAGAALHVEVEPVHARYEPAEREDGGTLALRGETEGVGHDGALREAAEHEAVDAEVVLLEHVVDPPRQRRERLEKVSRSGEPT